MHLKTGTLIELFEKKDAWQNEDTPEYKEWKEALIEAADKLNYDAVVELALYLAFEAKLNDRQIWRAVENAALANLHLYELKHTC